MKKYFKHKFMAESFSQLSKGSLRRTGMANRPYVVEYDDIPSDPTLTFGNQNSEEIKAKPIRKRRTLKPKVKKED